MWLGGDFPRPHVSQGPLCFVWDLILHEPAPAETFCSLLWITASLRGNAAELFLHFSVAPDLKPGLVSVAGSFLHEKLNTQANSDQVNLGILGWILPLDSVIWFIDACWKSTFHELFWLTWKGSDFLMCVVHIKLREQIPLWAASAFPSPSPAAALVLFYMNLKAMCVYSFHG